MKQIKLTATLVLFYSVTSAQSTDSASIFYAKALEAKRIGQTKVAYDHLRRSVSYNPEQLEAQKALGEMAIDLRQYETAKKAYGKVSELKPDDTSAISNLANLSMWTHKWDDAIKYSLKMRQLKIGGRANYNIGKSYYEQENYGQAFQYLDAAFKEEPNNAEIPYLFARAFVDMSNYRQAAKYYEEAVKIDSTKSRWYYEMAMTYAAIPDDKTAIKYYQVALGKGQKLDNDFLENMANSYVLAGQAEQGIDIMKQLLEKRPADLSLLNNIADTYYRIQKYDLAIEHWDKILTYNKTDAKPLYMIGMCYLKKGDKAKGEQLCDKAIEMDPSLAKLKTQKKLDQGL